MAFKQWNKLLFFVTTISAIIFLSYQAAGCHACRVPERFAPAFRLTFAAANAADIEQEESAKAFIQSMGNEVVSAIGDASLSREQKKSKLEEVLNRNFDMNTINRFTMGQYWKRMTPIQQKEYAELYEQMIVSIYADRFSNYKGETLKVGNTVSTATSDFIVHSHIIRLAEKNIQVDWHVRFKNGKYKIIDVAIEGVSMIITQKADFSSAIQRKGGDPAVILDFLRDRLEEKI